MLIYGLFFLYLRSYFRCIPACGRETRNITEGVDQSTEETDFQVLGSSRSRNLYFWCLRNPLFLKFSGSSGATRYFLQFSISCRFYIVALDL